MHNMNRLKLWSHRVKWKISKLKTISSLKQAEDSVKGLIIVVFKDRLYWGMFIIGFILMYCFYEISIEHLSMLVYNSFISQISIGFIIGILISKIISEKFSQFNLYKGENNKNVKNTSIIITVIVVILLISIFANVEVGFDLIQRVYCDNEDDVVVSESNSTKSNIENDDNSYHFSISKKFVKEGFESVLKVLTESLPEIIGGFGGAKFGVAVEKSSTKIPPIQRAALGVISGGAGMIALGLGGTVVRNIRKSTAAAASADGGDLIVKLPRASLEIAKLIKGEQGKEEFVQTTAKKLVEYESTKNGGIANEANTSTSTSENLNNVDLSAGDGGNFIPSLLDGNLSPLELLINCEILTNIMILFHILLLVLILIQKFNIKIIKQSSVGFISKFLNKYKINKVQNFINKLGELNNKYLSLLIIINVIIIIFYVCLNVYINIELSNYLNNYIYVHIKFKTTEGCILLLLLNNEIKYKNGIRSRLDKRLFSSTNIRNIGRKIRGCQQKIIKYSTIKAEKKIGKKCRKMNWNYYWSS